MNEGLEKLIDEAGREKVFARAETYGWTRYSSPPEWVWRQIANEIIAGQPPAVSPKWLDEALLGFRLI